MDKTKYDIPIGIPEFYKGRSIFVTGFTGYIGKLVVEKLLYSCPEIEKIYVLIRTKKDQKPQERAQNILRSRVFIRLHEKYPDLLESKVVALAGDVLDDRLGLSHENEELLRKDVSVIFYGAASVRFDDPLREAVQLNTLGVKNMIDLALTMPNLDCLMYISTAYTNCDNIYIKEEIYPPKADWRKTLEICEKTDPAILQTLHLKYVGGMPNTYVFSKSLAEHIVNDYRDRLPVVVVRPAIVVPAWKEPIPGWTDNKYGPIGLVIGFFLGLIRCSWVNVKEKCNYIMSDIVVNSIIVIAWKTALTQKPEEIRDSAKVYNVCSPLSFNMDHEEFSLIYQKKQVLENMVADGMNFANLKFSSTNLSFKIHNLYRHLISAYFVDLIMILNKRKPLLVSVRRKIFSAAVALSYFTTRTFKFQTDNFDNLIDDLKSEDKDTFGWDFKQIDYYATYRDTYIQSKHTILKPLFDDLDTNRRRLRMLNYVDGCAIYMTYILVAFIIYHFRIIQFILSALQSFVTLQ